MSAKIYKLAGIIGQRFFVKTGEFRAPHQGEFYLSGATPEVYQAPNDLSFWYNIMRELDAPAREITVNGFVYTLKGAK